MIFVTVGTPKYGFSRLVEKMDEIARKEKVIIQTGSTNYVPKNADHMKFMSRKEFEDMIMKSDVVVTHAGVGSIIQILDAGKPIVVVPRRKHLNEHVNDHQMDITKEFEESNIVTACYDVSNLEKKIKQAKKLKPRKESKEKEKLLNTLDTFLKGV